MNFSFHKQEMEKKEEDCSDGLQEQEWYWANASKEEIASAICVRFKIVPEICVCRISLF